MAIEKGITTTEKNRGLYAWDENIHRMLESAQADGYDISEIDNKLELPEPYREWALNNLGDLGLSAPEINAPHIPREWINTTNVADAEPSFSNGKHLNVSIAPRWFELQTYERGSNIGTPSKWEPDPKGYQRFTIQHDAWKSADLRIVTDSWEKVRTLMDSPFMQITEQLADCWKYAILDAWTTEWSGNQGLYASENNSEDEVENMMELATNFVSWCEHCA
jgi:hypothetical protein